MANIAPFLRRIEHLHEEVDDKHHAHPELECHVDAIVQEIDALEGVVRDEHYQQKRQYKHDGVHGPLDDFRGLAMSYFIPATFIVWGYGVSRCHGTCDEAFTF